MTDASRRLSTPARVGIVILLCHALWIAAFFLYGHQARDFVRIGYRFVQESSVSSTIKFDPTYMDDGLFVRPFSLRLAHMRSACASCIRVRR